MLIALSGLPGTGKTTIARQLSRRISTVHVRIDTIEQSLLRAGFPDRLGPEGYDIAYGIAADNLQLGHRVVADCVNASQASRRAWKQVALACRVPFLAVHLVCGDANEHRRRVLERQADIEGHNLPTWEHVSALTCNPPLDGIAIDTSACSVDAAVTLILHGIERTRSQRAPA